MIFFIILNLLILACSGVVVFFFSNFPGVLAFFKHITLVMPYSFLIVIFLTAGVLSWDITRTFYRKISFIQAVLAGFFLIGTLAITDFMIHYPRGVDILQANKKINIMGLAHGFSFEQSLKDITGKSEAVNFKQPLYNDDGKFGFSYQVNPQSVFTLKSIEIPSAGAWCFWCRVKAASADAREMRILDANGYWIALHPKGIDAYFKEDEFIHVTAYTSIKPEEWFHVAAVWEPGKFCIYINGTPMECNGTFNGNPEFSRRDLVVGARWNGNEKYFHGEIDELCIFEGPVNQEKIVFIMQNGLKSFASKTD